MFIMAVTKYAIMYGYKIKSDTFFFPSSTKPDLINFDAEKILLAVTKENKTLDEYLFQYKNARELCGQKRSN